MSGHLVNFLFAIVRMDEQEEVYDRLLQKIDQTELENVLTCLAENATHGHGLQPSIVLHVVAEFVSVFHDCHVARQEAKLLPHL